MEATDEKPVCLIEVLETATGSEWPFELRINTEALEILESIKDKMVISIFGVLKKGGAYFRFRAKKKWKEFPMQPNSAPNQRF
jgi:hypothetical protein